MSGETFNLTDFPIDSQPKITAWLRQQLVPLHDNCTNNNDEESWSPSTVLTDQEVVLIVGVYAFSLTLAVVGNLLAARLFNQKRFACADDVRPLLANFCFVNLLTACSTIPSTLTYQLVGSWIFPRVLCSVITCLQVIAATEVILTHLAIGFNRLWSILFPYRTDVSLIYGQKIIFFTWFLAFCLASPSLIGANISRRGCFQGRMFLNCAETWSHDQTTAYTWTLLVFMFVAPTVILVSIYVATAKALKRLEMEQIARIRTSPLILSEINDGLGDIQGKKKILRMLEIIFGLFVFSTLPLHVLFVVFTFTDDGFIESHSYIIERVYWTCHWLSTSTSWQGPIVYLFFRDQFKNLIPDCQVTDDSKYPPTSATSFGESPDFFISGEPSVTPPPIAFTNNLSLAILHFGSGISPSYQITSTSSYLPTNFDDTTNITDSSMMVDDGPAAQQWVPTYSNDVQVLVILVAYTISFLLSFGGNWLAIVIFLRYDYWPKDLRLLLTNICVAGLLSAVLCLPFTLLYQLLQSWVFTRPLCRIITFLQLAATIGTILTHLAIGLNRLWVIVFPLKAASFQEYVWRIIGATWLVAAVISGPNLITTDTKSRRDDGECYAGKTYLMCMEQWEPEFSAAYTWALMICMYFLPMIVLLCIYGIAGYVLSRSQELIHNERSIAKRVEVKRKVLRMLMLIFALFALSWLPLHTFFIFQSFHEQAIMANFELAERVYWVIHWMATSNSFQNPIVYCFFDEKFKVGVSQLFGSKKPRSGIIRSAPPGVSQSLHVNCHHPPTIQSLTSSSTRCAAAACPLNVTSPQRISLGKTISTPVRRSTGTDGLVIELPFCLSDIQASKLGDVSNTTKKRSSGAKTPNSLLDGGVLMDERLEIDISQMPLLGADQESSAAPVEPSPKRVSSIAQSHNGEESEFDSVFGKSPGDGNFSASQRQSSSSDLALPLIGPEYSPTLSLKAPDSDSSSRNFFVLYEYTVL